MIVEQSEIKKTLAAVLIEQKNDLLVTEISLPKELKVGQVLVKYAYSGICGSQIGEIEGVKGPDKWLPHLLGHEGSGRVIKVGPGVTRLSPGDTVVAHWKPAAGIEAPTPLYMLDNTIINAGFVTTFNEYGIVSENRLTKIPKNFDKKTAALFGCAITTGFGVISNESKLKIGQSIIILGLGGIGLSICQSASLMSAYPIIGVDLHKNKIAMAKKFGLTHGILNKGKKLATNIKKILNDGKADVVIEATGKKNLMELAYNLTKNKGETIFCGQQRRGDLIKFPIMPDHHEKKIKISLGGSAEPQIDINNYIRLFKSKKINMKKIITHEYPLERINEAFSTLKKGKAGRILIKM